MSATFKNAKKKMSQLELRKIMNDHKGKLKPTKTINSPLAKYPFMCCYTIFKLIPISFINRYTQNNTSQKHLLNDLCNMNCRLLSFYELSIYKLLL